MNDNSYNVKQAIQAGPTKESSKKQAVNKLFFNSSVNALNIINLTFFVIIKQFECLVSATHSLLFSDNSNLASPSKKLVKVQS